MTNTAPFPTPLMFGDLLPWFSTPIAGQQEHFEISKMGGKHVVLLFFGSAAQPGCEEAIQVAFTNRALLDDDNALFFGVSIDPADFIEGRIKNARPGIRFLADISRRASLACGVVDAAVGYTNIRPCWLLVDPTMRIIGRFALGEGEAAFAALGATLAQPPVDVVAPVLVLPNVLESDFCQMLIGLYETHGGEETGFMRHVDGKTVGMIDHSIKRRSDYQITDEAVQKALMARLSRRLIPMIKRVFEFQASRIERYIVARYDSGEGGHFRPHRDNTTPGTAHRRFAVTINLNGDYEGGDLRFPEFGMRTYRAPPGGAAVFNCSLLHEATRMTAGTRYATLPFLYDDAAAKVREANWETVANKEGQYRAFRTPEPTATSVDA